MLDSIRNLILDMDGVLWHGNTPLPGLNAFFDALDNLGIGYVLATNNATKTAVMYTEKLARFGVDVAPERILTSAETTAAYLRERYEPGTTVYIVGDVGLRTALEAQGFTIASPAEIRGGARPPLVVAGFTPHACYDDFAMATVAINRGATFIGTNPDVTYPTELGPQPGAGALLALITAATGVTPSTVGKPGPIVFEQALKRLGGTHANTAMVGDRLSTDILGARNAGLRAILVLSGISTAAEAAAFEPAPDLIVTDIRELTARLTAVRSAPENP